MQIAGRSKHHAIDRVVLYHSDVSSPSALRLSRPVSEYINPPVSVTDLAVERLKVSPNPVTTEVSVQLPSDITTGTYEVRIVGSDGREFGRQPYRLSPGGTLQMPVAKLPAGHYMFHFSVPGKHYTGRFIR
ncbi:T9SS type A sorting domain-containing protein [Neolewinella persica]|uniref:T9SS type A sorting domain-containing protein n=1 Tax=Neolewinella persica TaxID=70998 RepID=UPI00039FBAEA|nr:T9SS type A sorting domain-containing protein [Neolewinella persica]